MNETQFMFRYKKAILPQSQETNPSISAIWSEIVFYMGRKLQKRIKEIRLEEESADNTIRNKN